MDIFSQGVKQNLEDIMKSREQRVIIQENLLIEYKNPLISFKLNIPGDIKTNTHINLIFDNGVKEILEELEKNKVQLLHIQKDKKHSGDEAYIVFTGNPLEIKSLMCKIEDKSTKGRLYDIDIITCNGESVSRTVLGLSPRKCLICTKDAVICGRNRSHTVNELQNYINKIYSEYYQ